MEACTLQQFIDDAIRDVIELRADSHIVKVDRLWEEHCYTHIVVPGERCPCDPVAVYTDPGTGYQVYVHRRLEA
jgi:hypothetical protein